MGAAAGVVGGKAKPKRSITPQPAPTSTPAGPMQPVTPGYDPSNDLAIISQYNQAYGNILKGVPGQIGKIYSDAANQLSGMAGGFSQGARDRLAAAGEAAQGATGLQSGSEFANGIAGSYNPTQVADLTYALGGYFPSSSLTKQGAAWQSAAELLPEKAYGQGQYALLAAQRANQKAALKAASASGLPKASASLSRSLGYLVDVYGQPILNPKGKTIPVSEQMTPYQIAQLNQSEYHFQENFQFKTQKAQDDYNKAIAKGAQPNAALSAKYGYIVDSNGRAILNDKGRHIPVAKSKGTSAKPRSVYQSKTLDQLAQTWYAGAPGKLVAKKDANGNPVLDRNGNPEYLSIDKGKGKIGYQAALRKLMRTYKLKLADAQGILDQYWKRGERGRPYFSYQERQELIRRGYPAKLVNNVHDPHVYNEVAASLPENGGNGPSDVYAIY